MPRPKRKISRAGEDRVQAVVAWLEAKGTQAGRDAMARYAIPSDKAFGVGVGVLRKEAKRLGKNHALALGLWKTGWYEARMMAAFLDEPAEVTGEQMQNWCEEFDNWAIVDTVCFHLFDRTPFAWRKIPQWARRSEEFVKRAAFALLWSLTVHDKTADNAAFLKTFPLIERAADDDRNFVKKAVNMALRAVGKRNADLHAAALALAERLSTSQSASARWIGKDALRELSSAAVLRRISRRK